MSQFTLLNKKRFGPFFWTQFLGAFNDNVFKNALLITFAFQGAQSLGGTDPSTLVNLSAGLFILPFFLFSAIAGQLADKYEKGQLIRWIKLCEILLMSLAAIGFIFDLTLFLMIILFMMGTQSAFFGPVKYSILPQHLKEDELVGGNGMVEMGTFLAILLGTIVGGVLIAFHGGPYLIAGCIITVAFTGWFKSRGIPKADAASPDLKVSLNPLTETWNMITFSRQNIVVFRSILGISWFWFYGAIFLAQMPTFTENVLHANEHVVTLLLTLFSVGIGVGSLLCEKLSNRQVELGLVPFGSIGLTLFALDLWWVASHYSAAESVGFLTFVSSLYNWRMMLDLVAIGLFGGFYIVPLYALIQKRSPSDSRSRVIAGNNILNAFFMVLAAIMAILFLGRGYSIPQLFLLVAVLNALVAMYIFALVPEFLLRFLVWIVVHAVMRLKVTGKEPHSFEGGTVIVSDVRNSRDIIALTSTFPRPLRFILNAEHLSSLPFGPLLKAGKSFARELFDDPDRGFESCKQALQDDQVVVIPTSLLEESNLERLQTICNNLSIPIIDVKVAAQNETGLRKSILVQIAEFDTMEPVMNSKQHEHQNNTSS